MPGLFVEDQQVAYARQLAKEIARPVLDLVKRHTTVSIERTVLRLLGLSGAGAGGVPLPNLIVDRLQAAGLINRGAAYWYGRALHMGAKSPLRIEQPAATIDEFSSVAKSRTCTSRPRRMFGPADSVRHVARAEEGTQRRPFLGLLPSFTVPPTFC